MPSAPTSPDAKRWTVRSSTRRAAEVLRTEGARALWFKVLGETVFRRLILVELRPNEAPAVSSGLELELRFLEPGDAEAYARLRPGAALDGVRRRLEQDRCFGAWHAGELVSTRWVVRGRAEIEYLGRTLDLPPHTVWIADTYTGEPWRGQDVSPAAGAALAHALAAEGVERQLGGVHPENKLGIRAYEQAGYRRVGTIGYVRLGRWRRDYVRRSG